MPPLRTLRAAGAALLLLVVLGWAPNTFDTHSFTVVGKTWTTVPEEYQRPHPGRKICVGAWENLARSRQDMLYLHRVGKMGWEYIVKDRYGRNYTLFAGKEWAWSGGDRLLITGEISGAKVFIPQGVYVYD